MAIFFDVLSSSRLITWAPVLFFVYWAIWIIYARFFHPLAKVPGPFLASISRTWLMWRMHVGDVEIHQRALHKKYGPVIRIAHDEVAISDPEAIPLIYPLQKPLEKTDWYHAWRPMGLPGQPDLFTQTNEKAHSNYRRTVGGVYALSNVLKNEYKVDKTVNLFLERIRGFADRKEAFDFGFWLEMYAFDNVGAVIFGEEFGFLEKSIDYGNYIDAVHLAMPFLSVLTVSPSWLRPFLMVGSMVFPKLLKAVIAVDGIRKNAIEETKVAAARTHETTSKRTDFMSQLLTIVREKGEKVNFTFNEVQSEAWVAVMAGADSTSIALRSVFYYLMKHPEVLKKLREEIDAGYANGTLSHPVQYNEASALPYLTAVVKESTRLFPAFQVTMPRTAPAQGIEICGKVIPAGYKMGMNPAVVQLINTDVFGEDASEFRPERWLESEDRNRAMEKATLTFGAGTRQCTGRPLAMTEIYKIVPEILSNFTFEMAHDRPWHIQNAAFCWQRDVVCNFKRKESS